MHESSSKLVFGLNVDVGLDISEGSGFVICIRFEILSGFEIFRGF